MAKYIMRAPSGETAEVEQSEVSHYRKLGAAVIGMANIGKDVAAPVERQQAARRGVEDIAGALGNFTRENAAPLAAMAASQLVPPLRMATPAMRAMSMPARLGLRAINSGARVGAAELGGMAGSVGQQVAEGGGVDPRRVLRSGIEQGGAQIGGELFGAAVRPFAEGMTDAWLRPTDKMLRKRPHLVEETLEMGAAIPGRGKPVARAAAQEKASGKMTGRLVASADKAGVEVTFDEATASLRKWRDRIAKRSTNDEGLAVIDDYLNTMRGKFGKGQKASDAHEIKRQTQTEVNYNTEQGTGATLRQAKRMVARDLRATLGKKIRGYNESDAVTSSAINVGKAVQRAGGLRPAPASTLPAVVGAVTGGVGGIASGSPFGVAGPALGAAAAGAMSNPYFQSRIGPLIEPGARQIPRVGLEAWRYLTGGQNSAAP